MGITFTPQQLRGLKATAKRQEIRDLGGDNLYVVVQPKTGEISFVMRVTIDGKQRKKTIGSFPAISLAEARDKAREVKVAIRRGEEPPIPIGPQKPETTTAGPTVEEAWNLYWKHEGCLRKSAREKQRIFNVDVRPTIGSMPLKDVTRSQLAHLIKSKYEAAPTASNRLHSLLARFFKWCFTKGEPYTGLTTNPMASVVKLFSERETARTRYLSREELAYWFKALHAAGEHRPIHELLMRTLCRFSDIMDLSWGEVSRLENGDHVLILDDTKNGQSHLVWLHPSAYALLPERPQKAKASDRVFQPKSRSGKPVERIREKMRQLAMADGVTIPHWQPHDYRRTGTTHLAGMLDENDDPIVPDHILDKLLAHKENRVIRHYNRHGYFKEKKMAIRAWNDSLDSIRSGI